MDNQVKEKTGATNTINCKSKGNVASMNVGNHSQGTQGRSSAKWDTFAKLKFIELCEEEIRKGNRPNSHFSRNGWNNLVNKFNVLTGRNYVQKQMRNHWDSMKKDWILFRNLMNKETGIGWDPTKSSIDASDEWWERKIKENENYIKFRRMDLSLIWFRYDQLFSDVAATGERARAPSQRSEFEDSEEENLEQNMNDIGYGEEHVEVSDNENIEATVRAKTRGTNEHAINIEDEMFPSSTISKRKRIEDNVKGKKKLSGSASLREDIHTLLQCMANKNPINSTPTKEISIAAAIEMLSNVPGITPRTELWNYACNLLSKKEMCEVFMSQPSHESRLG